MKRQLLVSTAALLLALGCGSAAPPSSPDSNGQPVDAAAAEPPPDAEPPDAEPPDTEPPDAAADAPAGGEDAALADAVAPDLPPPAPDYPAPPGPYARPAYTMLSETGLFADISARVLAPGFVAFAPSNVLWADGAEKHRWVSLPPGTKIDTSKMDHWVFPIGTRFFKQFDLGGVPLETRLIERYGTGPEDYWMGAFVWKADLSDAVFVPDGQQDLNGTPHDAPAQKDCRSCHAGEPGRVLGFSALQLSRDGEGTTLDWLGKAGLLSDPPAPGAPFHPPGDATTAAALGYLHANCGHCHNPNGTSWPDTQMVLRLGAAETTPEATDIYKTTIGQKLEYFRHAGFDQRVVAGDPAMSALMFRMQSRTLKEQMPPLATEMLDPTGVDAVMRWISSLPK